MQLWKDREIDIFRDSCRFQIQIIISDWNIGFYILFYKETILCQDKFIFLIIKLKLVYAIHASKVLEGDFWNISFYSVLKITWIPQILNPRKNVD